MRHYIRILLLTILPLAQATADLLPSVDAFLKTAKDYDFSADHLKWSFSLSVEEPQQPEVHPNIVSPTRVNETGLLWGSTNQALIYVTSRPPTESTPAETGLLIVLTRTGSGWYISEKRPFRTFGKFANLRFELTSEAAVGHRQRPFVTVTATNGGRGSTDKTSATYELLEGRLILKEP